MRKALAAVTCLFSLSVFAGQFEDMTSQGHDFAADQQSHINGYANGVDTKASTYGGDTTMGANTHPCNQVNAQGVKTCGGQTVNEGENPQQYYGLSQVQLEDEARLKASTDENAQYVFGAHQDRPDFEVRRDDPLFKNQESNQNKMVSLSDTYAGCKDIAYGGTITSTESAQCKKYGTAVYRDTNCTRTLDVTCSNPNVNQTWPYTASEFSISGPSLSKSVSGNVITFGGNSRGANCNGYDNYVTFNIENVDYVTEFVITDVSWDDSFYIEVNGTAVHMARGSAVGTSPMGAVNILNRCEYSAVFSNSTDKNVKPYLKNGSNTIRIWNRVGGSGFVKVIIRATRFHDCDPKDSISEQCEASFDRTKASLVSTTCTSWAASKTLYRDTVTRSCWEWQDTYRWEDLPTFAEDAQCASLRDAGCTPNGSTCDELSPSGWCKTATMNFQCMNESPEKTMQVCGDTLVCPGGSCYDQYKTTQNNTGDFMKAASYLAMMEDMKNNFDPANVTIWKGEFKECSVNKTLIGSDQCCTGGSGTINTMGKKCNPTEERINQARNDKTASFLRSWDECTQEVAGVCVNELTHYEFCLWPSKLARIVQDQGRPMLGQRVWKPCPGFKLQDPNELMGLDWNRIDLSDYFTDVTAKYNSTPKPNGDALKSQMEQSQDAMKDEYAAKMEQYYGK
jgi:conjugal transfer mating pair stabilization protein TraN